MYCGPYSAGVLHSVSDQIQNLQNCFTTTNKNDKDDIKGLVSKVPSSMVAGFVVGCWRRRCSCQAGEMVQQVLLDLPDLRNDRHHQFQRLLQACRRASGITPNFVEIQLSNSAKWSEKFFQNKLKVWSLSYVLFFVLKDNFLQCCASVTFWYGTIRRSESI
jgi:hypothetical protein